MAGLPSLNFKGCRLPDGRTQFHVAGGRFVAEPLPTAPTIDLGGRVVLPAFIDGHIHLDKSFVGDRWTPHRPARQPSDVRERVALEKELLARAAPLPERATALIELAVAQGTLRLRSHVDIDPTLKLSHLEALLALRQTYAETIDIELVAFPQSGILSAPGTAELLDEALRAGADLVGGLDPAGFDRDVEGHLNIVFACAERRGAGVDIHLHEPHMLGIFTLEQIALRTRALGLQGRVAVSHAYALGEVPEAEMRRTAETLARSGVAIMTNAPGAHAFPPVRALAEAGVTVFAGNDNIRDAWWPYGDADMLRRVNMIGYRSGFFTDAELELALSLATYAAARVLRVADYGLTPGAHADFVAVEAANAAEAVAACPADRDVYRGGRLVAAGGRFRRSL